MAVGTTTTKVLVTPQSDRERFHANFGSGLLSRNSKIPSHSRKAKSPAHVLSPRLTGSCHGPAGGNLTCPNGSPRFFLYGKVDLLAFQVRAPNVILTCLLIKSKEQESGSIQA